MGVHWRPALARLQELLGNPAGYKPFTTTFIFGSWDGKFLFAEPMITRATSSARRARRTRRCRTR
jgi:hypothetical protein